MQIGVSGDPGLHQILETPSGKLLLPDVYKRTLTMANVLVDGNRNIEAGVGYFLWVFAHFGYLPDPVQPSPPSPVQLNNEKHGKRHHAAKPTIKTHYAVTGWKHISLAAVSDHYNGGGDGNYLDKLQYAYSSVIGEPASSQPNR